MTIIKNILNMFKTIWQANQAKMQLNAARFSDLIAARPILKNSDPQKGLRDPQQLHRKMVPRHFPKKTRRAIQPAKTRCVQWFYGKKMKRPSKEGRRPVNAIHGGVSYW